MKHYELLQYERKIIAITLSKRVEKEFDILVKLNIEEYSALILRIDKSKTDKLIHDFSFLMNFKNWAEIMYKEKNKEEEIISRVENALNKVFIEISTSFKLDYKEYYEGI